MPLERCKKDGKSGWRWGSSGTCYTGKDGKKRALKQGVAVEGPAKFKKIMEADRKKKSRGSDQDLVISQEEFDEALREYESSEESYTDSIIEGVAAHLKNRGQS